MKQQVINGLKVIVIGLVLSAGISYAGNWVAPAGPPPGNNAQGPINVGTTDQVKDGGLAVNHFLAFDNGVFTKDLYVKDLFNPGNSGDLYVEKLANNTSEHVCADAQGKLFLCGFTPPPPPPTPGTYTQTYELDNFGNPITYGDCTTCTSTFFLTPNNISSITVEIIGAGGGGGGSLAYPPTSNRQVAQSAQPSIPCGQLVPSIPSGSPTPPYDNEIYFGGGPGTGTEVYGNCQINSGGGGGGGAAKSIYTGMPTTAGVSYAVDIGKGGTGGTRKVYYTQTSSLGQGNDGQKGEQTTVDSTPIATPGFPIFAEGGEGGQGGLAYPPNTNWTNAITSSGGTPGNAGSGTVANGSIGTNGRISVDERKLLLDATGLWWNLTGFKTPALFASSSNGAGGASGNGVSGGSGGASCGAGQSGGSGGGGGSLSNPLVSTSGNGCRGGHGKVIFTWEI